MVAGVSYAIDAIVFDDPFANNCQIKENLQRALSTFSRTALDEIVWNNRKNSKDLKKACTEINQRGEHALTVTPDDRGNGFTFSVSKKEVCIYTRHSQRRPAESSLELTVEAEAQMQSFGIAAARDYFNAAISANSANPFELIREISDLQTAIRTRSFKNRNGQTINLSSADCLPPCARIAELFNVFKTVTTATFAFAHALLQAGEVEESEQLLKKAKATADMVPEKLARNQIKFLIEYANTEDCNADLRKQLIDQATVIETVAQLPINFRLGLCSYYLLGSLTVEASVAVCKPAAAQKLLEEIDYQCSSSDSVIEVVRNPNNDPRYKFLQELAAVLSTIPNTEIAA